MEKHHLEPLGEYSNKCAIHSIEDYLLEILE